MITEDFCSYEVAKLLKEKGFNEICSYEWGVPDISGGYILQKWSIYNGEIRNSELINDAYAAPTLQMAIKWLREVHNIVINIIYEQDNMQVFAIDIITTNGTFYIGNYNHYESAVEAALKYVLENLI